MESTLSQATKIYYFTGTGNALKTDIGIKDAYVKKGWTVAVMNLVSRFVLAKSYYSNHLGNFKNKYK